MNFDLRSVIIKDGDEDFSAKLHEAALCLKEGGLVAFPTETVYGLGANALDARACKSIYSAKGRPSDNPLIVHVSSMDMANELVQDAPPCFYELCKEFWPGPISFVLNKSDIVPNLVSGGLDSVALRMPASKIALNIIEIAGVPVAAPSANISGRPSPTRCEHVIFDLNKRVDYIVCGGDIPIGVESTVLDIRAETPVLLRPGAVSRERIETLLGKKVLNPSNTDRAPRAPGMKYRHYSPNAKVYVLADNFSSSDLDDYILDLGLKKNKVLYLEYEDDLIMARDLFHDFRQADLEGYELVLVKPVSSGELLEANINRLLKAASGI